MRTTKITLITALIAMGAILYGQAEQVQFMNTDYAEKSSRFENLVDNFLSMTERTERKGYKEPIVYMSYTVDLVDVVNEEHYSTEPWMASPFACSMAEADLNVEKWMTSPFESSVAEADLNVEEWMTRPFGSSVTEADLAVESWMTIPFEAAEHIAIESWMTVAF